MHRKKLLIFCIAVCLVLVAAVFLVGQRVSISSMLAAVGAAPSGYDTLVTVSVTEDLNEQWDYAVEEASLGKRVLVQLSSGVHQISRPLSLLPQANSSLRGHIELEGDPNGGTTITPARRIDGWQRVSILGRSDVWRAPVSGSNIGSLAFGVKKGTRARFPNVDASIDSYPRVISFDSEERDLTIEYPRKNGSINFYPSDVSDNPEIMIPIDGDMVQMRIASIRSVDSGYVLLPKEREREVFFFTAFRPEHMSSYFKTDTYADPSGSTHGYYVELGDRAQAYWLENSLRFLDQPGEWFYSEKDGEVYMIPPEGFDPTSGDVWANGEWDQILVAIGDGVSSLPSLQVENITFFMTGYSQKANADSYRILASGRKSNNSDLYGPADGGRIGRFSGLPHTFTYDRNTGKRRPVLYYEDPAAMYLENVSNVGIVDSRFVSLGGGAIRVAGKARNINIHGNIFQDVASFGVMFRNSTGSIVDYSKVYDVVIANNLFERVGLEYTGVPIFVQEKDHSNVSIRNNEITDAPFYGIGVSTGENTHIYNNKIVRAMRLQTDGGAIWVTNVPDRETGRAGGHEVVGNYIQDVTIPRFTKREAGHNFVSSGIYIDGGYKLSVRSNYINNAPIGIYYLCPHEGFYLLSNYLVFTDDPERYYTGCPTSSDGENLGRSLPVVEPTSATVNNQLSEHSDQYKIQANSGVIASVYAQWHNRGWLGGAGTVTDNGPFSITGVVWNDENSNGAKDGNEFGLAGRVVNLLDPETRSVVATAETSDKELGQYTIAGVKTGRYRIEHTVPEGSVRTTDDSLVIDVLSDTEVNFGIKGSSETISGVVWIDSNGNGTIDTDEQRLSGHTVRLETSDTRELISTVSTDDQGGYVFQALSLPSYRVTFNVPSGYARTTDDSLVVNVSEEVNFGIKSLETGYKISGVVWLDYDGNGVLGDSEPRTSGRTLILQDNETRQTLHTTTSSGNGAYSFSGLEKGSIYRITLVIPDGLVRTTDDSFAFTMNGDRTINFGIREK